MEFKNLLRLAMIEDAHYPSQEVTIRMLDRVERPVRCSLIHPIVMNGAGMFAHPNKGTIVMVDCTYGESPVIVSYLPNNAFSKDITNGSNTNRFATSDMSYPVLKAGEMAMQGLSGSQLLFDRKGNICLTFAKSEIFHTNTNTISTRTGNIYTNTAGGREIEGTILRDMRKKAKSVEEVFDKLCSPTFDNILTEVGRNPNLRRVTVTSGDDNSSVLRNPALVEKRELIYEFAIEDNVGGFKEENSRLTSTDIFALEEPGRRDMSRADTLNLNPLVPNNLMETVKGTVVDIYGNILDLNRNIISYNDIDPKGATRLEAEDKLLRRSIKYHFEMNSRKKPTANAKATDNVFKLDPYLPSDEKLGYSHSRWSVDVDSEGLTKINIPASTNTGNIPLLTRYSNSNVRRDNNAEIFRDPDSPLLDVLHLGFGDTYGSGVSLTETYAPSDFGDRFSQQTMTYHTAYHDILMTAYDLTQEHAVNTSINNSIDDATADAGGRSVHFNSDGSVEINIGKDNVDGKSIVQDLAGGIISRIGKDFNDNSIVSQLDGNIVVQVGGDAIDTGEPVDSAGVKFFVAHDGGFHEIEVNSKGIFIKSAPDTSIVIDSSKNLVLKSKGDTLLHGENVYIHGTADDLGTALAGERLVMRSGRKIF